MLLFSSFHRYGIWEDVSLSFTLRFPLLFFAFHGYHLSLGEDQAILSYTAPQSLQALVKDFQIKS